MDRGRAARAPLRRGRDGRRRRPALRDRARPVRGVARPCPVGGREGGGHARGRDVAVAARARAVAQPEHRAVDRRPACRRRGARARAQVLAARAAQRQAELALGYTRIVAPIAGRIGEAALTQGNLVNPASGVLATIVSQDPVHVAFPVSARELLEAQRKAGANGAAGLVVRVRMADGSLYPEPGRIDFADVQADRNTDTVLVRARLPNPRAELIDGQTVRVVVEGERPERALMIPQASLQLDQAGAFVLVVDRESKAQVRRVKLGAARAGYAAVLDGIAEGDRVVVQGIQRVRPGQPVVATDAPPGPRG
ncbi:MAG: efflux RND transporter periplasmic adaptor subunit [Alphaproteobacteria bacterium]|nr:efflux RND transporter periplasmic adaptor subunit [Alphaproteobacteria bacterium]